MVKADTEVDGEGMTQTTLTAPDLVALHTCATDGTLELMYQPEVDLATGAIVAMEGLLRWHRGELGVLLPSDFLDAAERTGDGSAIGDWVLATGAAEAAAWRTLRGGARQLWLNVSYTQLRNREFVDHVAVEIEAYDLDDGLLGLEISEATLRELGADATPILSDLQEAGVSLAVDDFTSWYATLGAIESLPLSCVKLGHRHVRGIDEMEHEPVAATVIDAAHERGLYVVAEGVETWGEAARLTELGCDRAHGWLFASAQRSDKARWLLSQGTGWRGGIVTPDLKARQSIPRPVSIPMPRSS
jgi:EAL domain-containing protein (putative c-di-GMP-specific phosphodiesterase class I)